MIYTAHRLLRSVRARLGADPDPRPLQADDCSCTALSAQIILENITAAAAAVMASADASLLSDVAVPLDSGRIQWRRQGRGRYIGRIALPAGYMRMLPLRMTDWQRAATDITDSHSAGARLVATGHPAFSGNTSRPVYRVEHTASGVWLEFAACSSPRSTIEQGGCVVYPRFDPSGGIALPEALLPEIIGKVTVNSE